MSFSRDSSRALGEQEGQRAGCRAIVQHRHERETNDAAVLAEQTDQAAAATTFCTEIMLPALEPSIWAASTTCSGAETRSATLNCSSANIMLLNLALPERKAPKAPTKGATSCR
jgi:hypothetical protein